MAKTIMAGHATSTPPLRFLSLTLPLIKKTSRFNLSLFWVCVVKLYTQFTSGTSGVLRFQRVGIAACCMRCDEGLKKMAVEIEEGEADIVGSPVLMQLTQVWC